jgi:hypothetical protein
VDPVDPSVDEPVVARPKISPVVEFNGHHIYKATLVSQLNANPFLSKDRLW